MNLHEIIHVLTGMNKQGRERELENLGVDERLWPHIQSCYDRRGRLASTAEWTPNLIEHLCSKCGGNAAH